MNAQDLEETGWYLEDHGRHDLLRHIGRAIWSHWKHQMRSGKHPARALLLAFLRGWAGPVGDWLPPGMALYLADRLDQEVESQDQGGRPQKRGAERLKERSRQLRIVRDVQTAWDWHKGKESLPQATAFKAVAEIHGVPETEVRIIFSRLRKNVERIGHVGRGDAPASSLTKKDLEALGAGSDPVMDLIIKSLTRSEIARMRDGESLESILLNPDDDPSPRPWPFRY